MVRGIVVAMVVAGSAIAALPVRAQPAQAPGAGAGPVTHVQTASDLAAVCDPAWQGVSRLEAIAYCQGYLTSFGQYHALMHPQGGRRQPLFCVPSPGLTIAESGIGFAAWLRSNPAHASEPAPDGLLRWAQSRFPCAAPAARPRSTR